MSRVTQGLSQTVTCSNTVRYYLKEHVVPEGYKYVQSKELELAWTRVENYTRRNSWSAWTLSSASDSCTAMLDGEPVEISESDKCLYVTAAIGGSMKLEAVSASKTYDKEALVGGATPGVTESTRIKYSTDGGETWTDTVPSIVEAGTLNYLVIAANPYYLDTYAEGTLTVNPKAVTVTAQPA